MTDLPLSRRAVTGALALLPALAVSSPSRADIPSAEDGGGFAMKMQRNIMLSHWNEALTKLGLANTAYEVAFAKLAAAQKNHFSHRPVDTYTAIFHDGDTIEAYNERTRAAKVAHERAMAAWVDDPHLAAAERDEQNAQDEVDAALDELLASPAPSPLAVAQKIKLAGENGREIADLGNVLTDLERLSQVQRN